MITVIETPAAQGLRGLKGDKGDAGEMPTLPSGTPTNVAVAENDQLTDALWKLQGQTLAARSIAIINTGSGSTYTMTAEESAAALWTFVGGTADCVVTPVINTLTQGIKYVSTAFSGFDITIDGVKFNKAVYGSQPAFMSEAGFILAPLSDGAANSRVFEQDQDSYFLADLINGTYNYFTHASAVTLTVQPESPTVVIPDNAEYQIERRGAVDLEIIAGSGVTIFPPKGGSLILEDGDFVVLKRTAENEYKLHGTTQSA